MIRALLLPSLAMRAAVVVAVASLWLTFPSTGSAQIGGAGIIELHNSNGGAGRICGSTTDFAPKDINFTFSTGEARNFSNDEARSAILYNVRAGAVIRLFDNSRGFSGSFDDWVEIRVLRTTPRAGWVVPTFQRSYTDFYLQVIYHSHNGLDGKVSRMEVR